MGLSKNEVNNLIAKIMVKDQDAFKEFMKEYGAIITLHTKKWINAVQRACHIYDFEDLQQEIWEHVIKQLPNYDSNKSSMVTWLYIMCDYPPGHIYRAWTAVKRSTGNGIITDEGEELSGEYLISLNQDMSNEDKHDLELIDFISDPNEALEAKALTDVELFEYIYMLKFFISRLNYSQRLVYLHQLKGLTQNESSAIIGISQAQVSRTRLDLFSKLLRFKDNMPRIDYKKVDEFAIMLLGPMDDDELSDILNCELAVIKICREILAIVDLYVRQEDVND